MMSSLSLGSRLQKLWYEVVSSKKEEEKGKKMEEEEEEGDRRVLTIVSM